jgi:hypothetical protein
MRAHGAPVADPVLDNRGVPQEPPGNGVSQSVPKSVMSAADHACTALIPQVEGALPKGQIFAELAKCMRAHGVPDFPDPQTGGGQYSFPLQGINTLSPAFQAAQKTCGSLPKPRGGGN